MGARQLEDQLKRLSVARFGRSISTAVRHESHAAHDKITLYYPSYERGDPVMEAVRKNIPAAHLGTEVFERDGYIEEMRTKVSRRTQKATFLATPEQVQALTSDLSYIRLDMARARWR